MTPFPPLSLNKHTAQRWYGLCRFNLKGLVFDPFPNQRAKDVVDLYIVISLAVPAGE